MGKFLNAAIEIGELTEAKNLAYGNSFESVGKFLELLYPNGVSVESFGDMLALCRIYDKLKRIATKKGAFMESPYKDLAGYAILGYVKDSETEEKTLNTDTKEDKQLCFNF